MGGVVVVVMMMMTMMMMVVVVVGILHIFRVSDAFVPRLNLSALVIVQCSDFGISRWSHSEYRMRLARESLL